MKNSSDSAILESPEASKEVITLWGREGMRYEPFSKETLKMLRAERGIKTQQELAQLSGVPEDTIKKLESGKQKNPNRETLSRLGKFFKVFLYADWDED